MPVLVTPASPGTPAAIGKGYTFSIGGTVQAGVLEIKPGKIKQEKITVQASDSATLYGDKILGWMDNDDWELKLIYTGPKRAALLALLNAWNACVFTRPDGSTTQNFQGAITELGDEVPLKEFMTIEIKLAVTGPQS